MAALDSLLYVSTARPGLSDADLEAVLDSALRHNAERGITGALLNYGGRFVQVLEGPADALDTLFATITRDPRHGDVRIVRRAALADRRFEAWSMRLVRVAGRDKVVEAFLADLSGASPPPETAARAVDLLAALARRA